MALSICNPTTDLYQKELFQHGDATFPIACFEDDLNTVIVPWHWHDEWEFIFVEKGVATVLLENAQFGICAGDGIFINSCALHAIDSQLSKDSILHSAVFHPRLIGGSIGSTFWNQLVLPLSNEGAPKYIVLDRNDSIHKQLLDDFHEAWKAMAFEVDDYENLIRYLLSRTWRSLCMYCTKRNRVLSAQDRVDAQRIRGMLTYIDENIAGELNTKQIAESVSISESVCLRCFHHMLGITPMQYVKQTRLGKAAELLQSSTMTTKAIAYECGFHDVSYFTKAFREKMECTPKEYQNSTAKKKSSGTN